MKTVKAKVYAYMWDWQSPEILEEENVAAQLTYRSKEHMEGSVCVGVGEVEITFYGTDTIVTNKIESLKQEKSNILAAAQLKATKIDGQIQELLAITYVPESE